MAIVQMPEAAINEDDSAMPGKHQIGLAWQASVMKFVSEPEAMEGLANLQFRLGVMTFDRGHVTAARSGVMNVSQFQTASLYCCCWALSRAWMWGCIIRATSQKTGTATEFPNCLYAWVSDTGMRKSSL